VFRLEVELRGGAQTGRDQISKGKERDSLKGTGNPRAWGVGALKLSSEEVTAKGSPARASWRSVFPALPLAAVGEAGLSAQRLGRQQFSAVSWLQR